ncbi:MAG: hypothetical protein WB810_07725 [Candidatus Cybelea sp.]
MNASSFGAISRLNQRLVALVLMLARPTAIAAMFLADRLASRAVHGSIAARIIAAAACAASALLAAAIARSPCSRGGAFGVAQRAATA